MYCENVFVVLRLQGLLNSYLKKNRKKSKKAQNKDSEKIDNIFSLCYSKWTPSDIADVLNLTDSKYEIIHKNKYYPKDKKGKNMFYFFTHLSVNFFLCHQNLCCL